MRQALIFDPLQAARPGTQESTWQTVEMVDDEGSYKAIVGLELIFRLDQAQYSRTLSVEETELRMKLKHKC